MIKYCLSRYSGVEEKSEQYIEVEEETVRHSLMKRIDIESASYPR